MGLFLGISTPTRIIFSSQNSTFLFSRSLLIVAQPQNLTSSAKYHIQSQLKTKFKDVSNIMIEADLRKQNSFDLFNNFHCQRIFSKQNENREENLKQQTDGGGSQIESDANVANFSGAALKLSDSSCWRHPRHFKLRLIRLHK